MPQVVELRVLISSSDDREDAADRIEAQVRRNLHRDWAVECCYVERVVAHPDPTMTRYPRG